MQLADISRYIAGLFSNKVVVVLSAMSAFCWSFLFPNTQYVAGAAAVLGMMILDLLTKLFALSRKSNSLKQAFKDHIINSHSFGKGTIDKLVVFGIMLIVCGLAYRLTIISEVATWFTQFVFGVMFLRDALSILENLSDAGVQGLGLFKKAVSKKLEDYVDSDEIAKDIEEEKTSDATLNTDASNNTDHI